MSAWSTSCVGAGRTASHGDEIRQPCEHQYGEAERRTRSATGRHGMHRAPMRRGGRSTGRSCTVRRGRAGWGHRSGLRRASRSARWRHRTRGADHQECTRGQRGGDDVHPRAPCTQGREQRGHARGCCRCRGPRNTHPRESSADTVSTAPRRRAFLVKRCVCARRAGCVSSRRAAWAALRLIRRAWCSRSSIALRRRPAVRVRRGRVAAR